MHHGFNPGHPQSLQSQAGMPNFDLAAANYPPIFAVPGGGQPGAPAYFPAHGVYPTHPAMYQPAHPQMMRMNYLPTLDPNMHFMPQLGGPGVPHPLQAQFGQYAFHPHAFNPAGAGPPGSVNGIAGNGQHVMSNQQPFNFPQQQQDYAASYPPLPALTNGEAGAGSGNDTGGNLPHEPETEQGVGEGDTSRARTVSCSSNLSGASGATPGTGTGTGGQRPPEMTSGGQSPSPVTGQPQPPPAPSIPGGNGGQPGPGMYQFYNPVLQPGSPQAAAAAMYAMNAQVAAANAAGIPVSAANGPAAQPAFAHPSPANGATPAAPPQSQQQPQPPSMMQMAEFPPPSTSSQ
jgi:hypothetical protein